jgi:hypothetical protein
LGIARAHSLHRGVPQMAHIWIATHWLIQAARNTIAAFHVHNRNEYPTKKHKIGTFRF